MAWKTMDIQEQRVRFVVEAVQHGIPSCKRKRRSYTAFGNPGPDRTFPENRAAEKRIAGAEARLLCKNHHLWHE